ncbi:MAG: hypothetical protein KF861_23205, partial [Planctomycetaceae bacterium]|nr:hypothetical protein [Planctomycetaceae bacterium]
MMTRNNALRCSWSALLIGLSASTSLAGQSAEIHSFNAPDGESYYAVSLAGDALQAPAAGQLEHVVLFDTSASQVGEHRQYGLQFLESYLKSLPAADRVALFAVDVDAVSLTQGAVAPAKALTSGMPALQSRFPAGSTNMMVALQAAIKQLSGRVPASVLYIGDGMSTAQLVQPTEMQELLGELQARRIPVHTFAVGPNTDRQLLGILSRHTGGRAMGDDGAAAADELAEIMADATRRPVFYPEQVQISSSIDGLLIQNPVPMRGDQETLYLGNGQLPQGESLTMSGTLAGQPASFEWTLSTDGNNTGNTFLYGHYR